MSSKGDLAVSLAGLSDLAADLESIKDRVKDTGRVNRTLGHGELGPGPAEAALDDFVRGWKDGRTEIEAGLDSVSKMARRVVEELTKRDEELAAELRKHQSEGGNP